MRKAAIIVLAAAVYLSAGGCGRAIDPQAPPPGSPYAAMLPTQIRLHGFTDTRAFSQADGVTGIEARLVALDYFGDETKAFGAFRFELYRHAPLQADPRGRRLHVWRLDLTDPQENARHWDNISRTYRFVLRWHEPIPTGDRLVLLAVFESEGQPRLFDQRVFVSGE